MQPLIVQPEVLTLLAACVIAAVALSTVSNIVRTVRSRRQARLLAHMVEELESIKRLHDGERNSLDARLTQIQHALDAVAVEMERVSEGQRYVTRLLSPPTAGGTGVANRP